MATGMYFRGLGSRVEGPELFKSDLIPSWKLTWKPKKGPMKTTVLLKGGYMGFHVSLGECNLLVGLVCPIGFRV